MKLYKSCKSIPVYNFYQVFDADDYRYLIKGYDDENDKIKLSKKQKIKFENIYRKIILEYSELTLNSKTIADYNKRILIKVLEFQYDICIKIIDLYADYGVFEVVVLLREYGYKIDEENTEQQLKVIINKLIGLKNQIRIHKVNYKNKRQKQEQDIKFDLERDALNFEKGLELGYIVNIKTTIMTRWIKLHNELEKRIQQQKNG